MPWYRCIVRGKSSNTSIRRSFYTSRSVYSIDCYTAEYAIIEQIRKEFTIGVSAAIWGYGDPVLLVEDILEISYIKSLLLPNRGSTFFTSSNDEYDENLHKN